jgi:putative oxidoreductase
MKILNPASPIQINAALAVLRVVAGSVFAAHGAQKLFVFGFAGVSGAFGGMGVPMPEIVGPATALLEFAGGLALIAGLLTRPIAAALAAVMIGAGVMVHAPNGFFMPNGYELVLTLFGAAATLAITGSGAWSLDALVSRRLSTRAAEGQGHRASDVRAAQVLRQQAQR